MPYNRPYITPTKLESHRVIRSLLFPSDRAGPRIALVDVVQDQEMSFPSIERLLSHHRLQPFVHDIRFTCILEGEQRYYRVFFKRHIYLPFNKAVWKSTQSTIKGDITVMGTDQVGDTYRDITRFDTHLAGQIISRLAEVINERPSPKLLPNEITIGIRLRRSNRLRSSNNR